MYWLFESVVNVAVDNDLLENFDKMENVSKLAK